MSRMVSKPEKRGRIVYFWLVIALFPLLLLVLLEASLRAFDYGDELPLFVPTAPGFADKPHLVINSRVAERYFPESYFVPRPTIDGFLQEKPANGYRLFVLGGSTTAGWPYPNNVMFTRLLQRRLAATFPEKHVEVVNLGIAAINSFTLLDFLDEVLAQQPDALLIYAGHNEFYGAFGAASRVSAGRTPALVRLYLLLQRFKLFLLLRNTLNRAAFLTRSAPAPSAHDATLPTLMGQVIGEEQVSLGSETYERGEAQFRENLDILLARTKAAGVPVVISELVSNVRDHPPFFFAHEAAASPAAAAFREARRLEAAGRVDAARAAYYKAKDLDGLRFRAPEEFNAIIRALAEKHAVPLVPMQSYFEAASPNGLIGNDLMLEHLHPNAEGHRLMSRAFFDTMRKHRLVSDVWNVEAENAGDFAGFSELDVAIGKIRILHLTDHWPFKPQARSSGAVKRYVPRTKAEELAKDFFLRKFSYREAHVRMAEYYARRGLQHLALREFWAMINSAPLDVEGYLGVAELLIRAGAPQQAWPFLEASLKIRSSGPDTAQLLMDLASAHVRANQVGEARRIFARLQASAPTHPGIDRLAEELR